MADLTDRELDAAGITGDQLRPAYRHARSVHAAHGRTYFLATRLLAPAQRPWVHALYGFARYADEIVDDAAGRRLPAAAKAARLDRLGAALDRAMAGTGPIHDPLLIAVAHTANHHRLDRSLFQSFLASMRMDTEIAEYASYAALGQYMYGSAGVIGLQMLPVLGTIGPLADAVPSAEALGVAFQLTNFLRDVGEDLDRGRLYLPTEELAAFGVDRELLLWCRRRGTTEHRVRAALAHLVDRTGQEYRRAEPGIKLLAPASRPCIRTAYRLYSAILDQIVAADYDVLNRRVVVPRWQRAAVAGEELLRGSYLGVRIGRPGRAVPPRPGAPLDSVRAPSPGPGA